MGGDRTGRPDAHEPAASGLRRLARPRLLLSAIAVVSGTVALGAAARTSTTYDEIVLIAGGARGWATGQWDIALDHPPGMVYLYGLPVHVARPAIPSMILPDVWRTREVVPGDSVFLTARYTFSRQFLWGSGNDPVRMAFLARLVGVAFMVALILFAYRHAAGHWGRGAGILAAGLIAFLPDTLAHGSIAYFDVPVSLAILLALAACDRAVREPTLRRGAVVGASLAFALSIKFTSILIIPAAVVILLCEAAVRGRDRAWWSRCAGAAICAIAVTYVGLVLVYRGDVKLEEFRFGLSFTTKLGAMGHPFYSLLLGEYYRSPPWFAYPVVEFFKTPAAFHLLAMAGIAGLIRGLRSSRLCAWLQSPLRAHAAACLFLGASLLWSDAQLASRYALPLMILLCIILAAGLNRLWQTGAPAIRAATVGLILWMAGSTLSFYPHFLAYTNEWGPGRDQGWRLFSSSNLDWGQGLLELRTWMERWNQEYVYLASFGSGAPAGYGIRDVPLPHAAALPDAWPAPAVPPRYAVISSHYIVPNALGDDPFREFREVEFVASLGHVLFVYDLTGRSSSSALRVR